MDRFYLIVISFWLMLFISCENITNRQQNETTNVNKLNYSIEDVYKQYIDSISNFSLEKKNIPEFIVKYHKNIENDFIDWLDLHFTETSRKEHIYNEIFKQSDKEKIYSIRSLVLKKEKLTKHDSLIIGLIGNIVK